jgi:hypothetical protein
MTDKEMALAIAETILRQQMSKVAFTSVLELYRLRGLQLDWQERVQKAQEELLSAPMFSDRIAELKTAFDEAKSDDELIHILHNELLYGGKKQD